MAGTNTQSGTNVHEIAEGIYRTVAALVSINDLADRAPRALADRETLSLGKHTVRWFDVPHLPHGWGCGYLFEEASRTLLCGDLFTQGGADLPASPSRTFLCLAR
ncbi:MAG: hypothetical protein ACM3KD_07350 [Hyphomicrobiaceae bacterium]